MLNFPNTSRSFDEARQGVRFVGYDGMFEVPFLVRAGALRPNNEPKPLEASYLAAFDAARASIEETARALYAKGGQTIYVIDAVRLN